MTADFAGRATPSTPTASIARPNACTRSTTWTTARSGARSRSAPTRRRAPRRRRPARDTGLGRPLDHAADDLPVERTLVDEAFAGDDEVGSLERLVESHLGGDQLESAREVGADGGEPSCQPPAAPPPTRSRTSVPYSWRYTSARRSRRRRRNSTCAGAPLLRGELVGGVAESRLDIAGHRDLDTAQPTRQQRSQRSQAAVGGGRPAGPHDDRVGRRPRVRPRSVRRCRTSRPRRRRCPRRHRRARARRLAISMTAVRPSNRHAASTSSPSGPTTDVDAVRPAEHVEQAFAAVGERTADRGVAGMLDRSSDRGGRVRHGRGAAEFVGSDEHTHATAG